MLIFRSEEHLAAWIDHGNPRGETLTPAQQWDLAGRWFRGRHLPEWKRRTPAEAGAVFASVGLTSEFWSLGA
jgi:hypothetical protein